MDEVINFNLKENGKLKVKDDYLEVKFDDDKIQKRGLVSLIN